MLRLAHTSAELSGSGIPIDTIEQIIGKVTQKEEEGMCFSPPFIDLGPAIIPISTIALLEKYPNATPPKGTIMLLESLREGVAHHSWLNVGEENKLEIEAKDSYKNRLESHAKCIEVQKTFYK